MEFSPPTVDTLRNKPVLIKGETVFSACPVEETEVGFFWRQVSGPAIDAELLSGIRIPQLLIPANSLVAGSVYQLGLSAVMGDISQSSESIVIIKVGYQELVASIAGGTRVSTFVALELSATGSRDLDIDQSAPQGLAYSWECAFIQDGERYSCRDSTGAAVVLPTNSPTASAISIAPGVLPPMDEPYILSVTVRKGSRSSLAVSKNVLVVAQRIPTLAIRLPDDAFVNDGALVMNNDERMIFTGLSSLGINGTSFQWSVSPTVNVSWPGVSPMGIYGSTFIFEGAFAQLQAGSKYTVQLLGTTSDGIVGQSQVEFVVNSAPLGGSFSVCLQDSNQAEPGCIKTGEAVTQDFRLEAAGWTDPHLPLMYEFGYIVIQSPTAAVGEALGATIPLSTYSSNVSHCQPGGSDAVDLGTAARFAVLANTAVTDAGGSTILGDMGTSIGTSLPVYPPYSPGTPGLDGTLHPNDDIAIDARAAAIAALTDINGRSEGETALGGVVELGGRTLAPGLYTATIAMQREFDCPCSSPFSHPWCPS